MAVTDVVAPGSGLVMEQVRIVSWRRTDGARVEKGELIFEIETDKATLEVEAPASGHLRILVNAGELIVPDQVVARISDSPDAGAPATQAAPPGPPSRLTPAARRRARELGLDPERIAAAASGTVPLSDVERLAPAATPAVSPMRRHIAQQMTRSAQEVPQFSISRDVDMTAANERRSGAGVSYMDSIIVATAKALQEHAAFRSHFENGTIVASEDVHIGVAVAVGDGLLVPVIRDAARREAGDIARERKELEEAARGGRLPAAASTGAALTISNLGTYDVDRFTALVNPPEAAILAVGRVAERVVAVGGAASIRPMVSLTLTVDHRVADGAAAALFLRDVVRHLGSGD